MNAAAFDGTSIGIQADAKLGLGSSSWISTRSSPLTTAVAVENSFDAEHAQQLLRKVSEGNMSAFWDLWQKYQKHLFLVCLRQMGGRQADAEDALSRAMLKSLDRLPRHARQVINPMAWLTRLTHNVCIEMHREQNRRRIDANSDLDSDQARFFKDEGRSPEETLLRAEILSVLRRTIDSLPPPLRDPFVLRFEHEVPSRQIADELFLSTDNVRKRIQKARAVLRSHLDPYLSGKSLRSDEITPGCQALAEPNTGAIAGGGAGTAAARAFARVIRLVPPTGHSSGDDGGPDDDPGSGASVLRGKNGKGESPGKSGAKSSRVRPRRRRVLAQFEEGGRLSLVNPTPGRLQVKLATLARYVCKHPRGWKKRLELAYVLKGAGHWDDAIVHFRFVLKKQPRLTDARVALTKLLRLTHRSEEAEELALAAPPAANSLTALHRVPDHGPNQMIEATPESWQELGFAHLNAGDFDRALAALYQAIPSQGQPKAS